jgi:DNA-binding CsgD family transcriptional regulator
VTEQRKNPIEPLVEPLTRREREILGLLADGLSAPEIAEKLTLAVSSVKWHVLQVYGKLGVNSKRQALNRASELGLLGASQPQTATRVPRVELESHADAPPLSLQVTRFFGREAVSPTLRSAWLIIGW